MSEKPRRRLTGDPYQNYSMKTEQLLELIAQGESARVEFKSSFQNIPELASAVGVSTRTIERALTKLQNEGRVARIVPTNGGHWEVLHTK